MEETCKSVSQKPLLPGISVDNFNGEALHIYQGKLTHQNSKTFMKLTSERSFTSVHTIHDYLIKQYNGEEKEGEQQQVAALVEASEVAAPAAPAPEPAVEEEKERK